MISTNIISIPCLGIHLYICIHLLYSSPRENRYDLFVLCSACKLNTTSGEHRYRFSGYFQIDEIQM